MARNRQIPKFINCSTNSNFKSKIHICAPYLNEPNNFLLEELHLILDIEKYKKKIFNCTTGNIFQMIEMSGHVICDSWYHLMSIWGSNEVKLTDERRFWIKFNTGFEIYRVDRSSSRYFNNKRLFKTALEDQEYLSLEYVGSNWPDDKSSINLDDQFVLGYKECL